MKSRLSYIACLLTIFWAAWFYPRWEKTGTEATLAWDAGGYYWYLPSVFIYDDLKGQNFKDSVLAKYQFTGTEFQQGMQLENGNYVLKYSSGMAIMCAPFFFIAHAIAPLTDHPADGFSKPYLVAISLESLLISAIGLWYLRKLLLRFYTDGPVAVVLLLLVVGTNYLNYSAIDGALSHNWLFTVYVFILLATDNFYRTLQTHYAVAIGLLCGLATLTRPTEVISLLLPLFWKMNTLTLSTIKSQLSFFYRHLSKLLIAAVCFLLVACIQLLYWKYVSGNWIVYSYGDQGFSWLHPHFFDYTFSYRSGWITYTPLAILFFIGIVPFLAYGKNKIAIISFFLVNYYIVCAWDIWWYAGTGGRAMIQSYPVLLFPLASLVQYLLGRKGAFALSLPVLLLFVYVNIWFTIQAHGGQSLFDSESATRQYYWRVIGRFDVSPAVQRFKDTDELFEGTPVDTRLIYADTAEECLDNLRQETRIHTVPLKTAARGWLRATAAFSISSKEWNTSKMAQFKIALKHNDTLVKEKMIRLHRMLGDGDSKQISIDLKLPETGFDKAEVWIWNAESEKRICMDDLKVYTFHE